MSRLRLLPLLFLAAITAVVPTSLVIEQRVPEALALSQNYTAPKKLPKSLAIETIVGAIEVTEPVLIELLQHPIMSRLKEIDQHGAPTYFASRPTFSRYEHSLGVFALLHLQGCSLAEQIAGLLHDASHTTYSHTADHLFKTGNQVAYQDRIHGWFLQKMGIDLLLQRYDIALDEVLPDNPAHTALKQKHPRLCADRIEYILHTGLAFGRISADELASITSALHFENGSWFLTGKKEARMMADLSVHFSKNNWSSDENLAWHYWLCQALQQAIAREIVSFDDLHFGTDKEVLHALESSDDKHIKEMLTKCRAPEQHFVSVKESSSYDLIDYPKCRGVDPLVREKGSQELVPLSQLDSEYKTVLAKTKQEMDAGNRIKFIAPAGAA